jgi:hypothetical protein
VPKECGHRNVRSIFGCNRGRRRNFGRRVLLAHKDCWKDIGMKKSSKKAKHTIGTRKEWLLAEGTQEQALLVMVGS